MLKNDKLDVYVFVCVYLLSFIYVNVHTCTDVFHCFPFFNRKLSLVLAESLLWGCFDPRAAQCIYIYIYICMYVYLYQRWFIHTKTY